MSYQQHQLQHTFRLDTSLQLLRPTQQPQQQQPLLQQPPIEVQQQQQQLLQQQQVAGPSRSSSTPQKLPYGAGDPEDGYDHTFDSMDEFNAWRMKEESDKCIEFIKGDTHTSKAVPPRFKEHTKLVCARHTRSGRKKYVKKHPERQRKVPSRKLEGEGCPASISYKTSFTDSKIKVKYNSEHSHEIGQANFPFTRKGRKAAAEKARSGTYRANPVLNGSAPSSTLQRPPQQPGQLQQIPQPQQVQPPPPPSQQPQQQHHDQPHPILPLSPHSNPSLVSSPVVAGSSSSHSHSPHLMPTNGSLGNNIPPNSHNNNIPVSHQSIPTSASLITASTHTSNVQHALALVPPHPPDITQERWDRMDVLFQSIRAHARAFDFPPSSVAALESILIRLYLESPIGGPTLSMGDPE